MRGNSTPIRVGISACLLGGKVRFDGGHKFDPLLTESFGRFFEWVPVCPEVELGLGIPRESLRLVRDGEHRVRLVARQSGTDHTRTMTGWARRRAAELAFADFCGYVLKKDSPSCGMERVRVYGASGAPARNGRGLFAAALMERHPLLPVEEEGRLHDMGLRENFIERVFAFHRWKRFLAGRPRARDLVAFHTAQKLSLLAHSEPHYRRMGQIVARAGRDEFGELLRSYGETFMEALRVRASVRKHANVLYHMVGYLKNVLDAEDKREITGKIEDYRKGWVPLVVPLTLLQHHFRRNPVAWIAEQAYLDPYPAELMLRNHV